MLHAGEDENGFGGGAGETNGLLLSVRAVRNVVGASKPLGRVDVAPAASILTLDAIPHERVASYIEV